MIFTFSSWMRTQNTLRINEIGINKCIILEESNREKKKERAFIASDIIRFPQQEHMHINMRAVNKSAENYRNVCNDKNVYIPCFIKFH
jgi:hypothetical protein